MEGLSLRHLFALSVGPSHITLRCAMHLQEWKKGATSAFTVAARATPQVGAQTDLMISERNLGQHQGTSRTTEQVT